VWASFAWWVGEALLAFAYLLFDRPLDKLGVQICFSFFPVVRVVFAVRLIIAHLSKWQQGSRFFLKGLENPTS
jgi:hypothetical protein